MRCANCGFVGYIHTAGQKIVTADRNFRETGEVNAGVYRHYPGCFKEVDLESEYRATLPPDRPIPGTEIIIAAKAVLHKERECRFWTEWRPGRSPLEHDDMILQQSALDIQARIADVQTRIADIQLSGHQWRKEQADRDEKFAMRLAALEEVRHQESLDVGQSAATGSNWQAYATIAATVIALIALIVSLLK